MKVDTDIWAFNGWMIRNKKTGKFVSGTDYRYHPPHQITDSSRRVLLYGNKSQAENDFRYRQCGVNYEIVGVEVYLSAPYDIKTENNRNLEVT